MYESILDQVKVGDVFLTCGRGVHLSSLLIKLGNFFKRGYKDRGWTHAAIYVGDGKVAEAFPSGIVMRDLRDAYLNGSFELLILRHRNASEDKLKKAAEFCANADKKKYDLRALFYFLLYNLTPSQIHFIWGNDFIGKCFNVNDSYFCSELVSNGLLNAGIYCFEREPYKVMPIEFNNELLFEKVAELNLPLGNKVVHFLKSCLFWILYLVTAILFPFIVLIMAALIIAFVALVLLGIWGVILFIIGVLKTLPAKKETDENQRKS